jgi:hypothetical protein
MGAELIKRIRSIQVGEMERCIQRTPICLVFIEIGAPPGPSLRPGVQASRLGGEACRLESTAE